MWEREEKVKGEEIEMCEGARDVPKEKKVQG